MPTTMQDPQPHANADRPLCRWPRALLAALALAVTVLLGVAQTAVYRAPYPWVSASAWLYAHLEPGATVAVELWDHPLPVPLPEGDPTTFAQVTLDPLAPESPAKLLALDAAAVDTDAIVLASRRGYGGLAAQPAAYAATLAWYRDLFATHRAIVFARCPRIGPLAITDDPLADAGLPLPASLAARCGTRYALRLPHLDENFRVYDAPTTVILAK